MQTANTLGSGKVARPFTYTGSVEDGVHIYMSTSSDVKLSASQFRQLLQHFSGKTVAGGFSKTDPTKDGFGEWIQDQFASITPPHGSFIAAVLVAEKYCMHSLRGNAVWLEFPTTSQPPVDQSRQRNL